MNIDDLFNILKTGGPVAVLAMILVTGWRGDWVFGRTHTAVIKERDEWKSQAMEATRIAERLTDLMEAGTRRRS